MVQLKSKAEYVTLDPNFKPLPKNGHLSTVDPEFAKVKDATDAAVAPMWEPGLDMDAFKAAWMAPPPAPQGCPVEGVDVVTELRTIPVRDGTQIGVKIYQSKRPTTDRATLAVRFHGGGWAVGGHSTEEPESLLMAGLGNVVVVSVDYRMAPEFKFPYAIEDSWDAARWAKKNAVSLGADPENIIFIGGSAGGGIAAVIAQKARDAGMTGVRGQILNFPVTCHPKFFPADKYEYGSYQQNHDASVVCARRMEFFLDLYLPDPQPHQDHSPLLAKTPKGLPPALVQVAGLDPLRDEGIAYAERLQAEGVPTELQTYQGMPHCFYMFAAHSKTSDYYARVLDFVKRVGSNKVDGAGARSGQARL
ncbi:alpha/beta hydrolase fold-3 domain-containing protein [Verticillium dahliae VdLs.17]|uniref:Alpha/beta hydrolase fold-3 domain-containing protein n=1 Tax=Verticillium dahliae (strain VdLs.17 / ATCC MYA-4575 / FGSC 10137) TaxID=498257 RepID=G2WRS5_VERDV|nr:alpha/beta hydrolase fold-3 domain-containing protein [Verticillium dahliae VdLs.17]EGY13576.1 alpha/beta hydrolase fold-3 domain-containing protein [Verticillium dahliae VdLs.17]